MYFHRLVVAAGLSLLLSGVAMAATTLGSLEPTTGTWRAYRGSNFTTLVCSSSSEAAMLQCIAADAEHRAVTTRYQLRYPNRYVTVSYVRPTCPTPPADQTRPGTCPTGTEGSWTQTGTTTYGPAPACTPTVTWRPATPPEGACRALPPPSLPAPTGVTATAVSTSEIRVSWNVVADALSYSLRRCIGATCTELRQLVCTQGLSQPHVTLPAGITVRYQVLASRDAACGALGEPSVIVSATTLTVTPPPPDPTPTGSAALSWTSPTANTDGSSLTNLTGYRISYGTSATALSQTIQVGAVTSYTVTNLSPGMYYFAVRALTANSESELSNIVSKTVQ